MGSGEKHENATVYVRNKGAPISDPFSPSEVAGHRLAQHERRHVEQRRLEGGQAQAILFTEQGIASRYKRHSSISVDRLGDGVLSSLDSDCD